MIYAKSTGGFYDRAIHGDAIPADAVDITLTEHAALLLGQSQGKLITADTLGRPVLTDPPPKPLIEVKTTKLAQLEQARDAETVKDVSALGTTWQADERSQKLLSAAITLAMVGAPLPPVWRDANNSNMPITTLAELVAIAGAMATQTQAAYSKSWTLKSQVDAAQTPGAVDAVVW